MAYSHSDEDTFVSWAIVELSKIKEWLLVCG